MRRKTRLEPILCSLLLFVVAGIAGIIAYQTDASTVWNRMVPGWNTSEITEEFPEPDPIPPDEENAVAKRVAVTNTSGVPCFVRVLLRVSNSDIPAAFLYGGEEGYHTGDWILGEDGYYYYQSVLEEGQVTSDLIDGVRVGGDSDWKDYWDPIQDIRVLVYAETVQAKNADTGMEWESVEAAWEHYLSIPDGDAV